MKLLKRTNIAILAGFVIIGCIFSCRFSDGLIFDKRKRLSVVDPTSVRQFPKNYGILLTQFLSRDFYHSIIFAGGVTISSRFWIQWLDMLLPTSFQGSAALFVLVLITMIFLSRSP